MKKGWVSMALTNEQDRKSLSLDIYTKDGKYILAKIVLLWRVKEPLKYFMNQRVAEDGETIKSFMLAAARKYAVEKNMEEILRNGKTELPEIIKTDLVGRVGRTIFEEGIFPQWGIELISVRVVDLDPIPEIKQEMKKRAEAEYQRDKTIIDAEAQKKKTILDSEGQKEQRINLAEAKRQEGFAEADINAKQIEKRIEAQKKALGLSSKEARDYDITVKMITEALSKANITTFDTQGIVRIATEIAKAIRGEK